jgi:hypothetical protein
VPAKRVQNLVDAATAVFVRVRDEIGNDVTGYRLDFPVVDT